jgi:hypothetical protein
MTNADTWTCQQSHDISGEGGAKGPSSTGDLVTCVIGRDGTACPVWKNPSGQQFAKLNSGSSYGYEGMRAMLTERDLYLWQGAQVLHGDFARQTGVDGVRVRLAANLVAVNEETAGVPSEFPWIFDGNGDLMDVERRREMAERWLNANSRLTAIYPSGFGINWYM